MKITVYNQNYTVTFCIILPFESANKYVKLYFYDYAHQTSSYRHRAALVNGRGTRFFGAKRSADAPQNDTVSSAGASPLHPI